MDASGGVQPIVIGAHSNIQDGVVFNCKLGEGWVVSHNSVVDGCDQPASFYVPSTTYINARTDLATLPKVTASAADLSEDVVRANNERVAGYNKLQNEF